jgi:type II secretion system protein G
MKIQKNKLKGFTLIELLVVVAIIGLLASVVLMSLNTARSKARDTERKETIRQIQTALEMYYNVNGQYPSSGGALVPNGSWSNSGNASWNTLQTDLKPYLPKLAKDPRDNATWIAFSYSYFSHGYGCPRGWYMLVYSLENAGGPDNGVVACDGTLFRYGGLGVNTSVKTVGSKSK